jgi:hypothetical protein
MPRQPAQLFWASKRLDGTIHVRRYFRNDPEQHDVEHDPAMTDHWGPYEAYSYTDACAEAEQVLGDHYF